MAIVAVIKRFLSIFLVSLTLPRGEGRDFDREGIADVTACAQTLCCPNNTKESKSFYWRAFNCMYSLSKAAIEAACCMDINSLIDPLYGN